MAGDRPALRRDADRQDLLQAADACQRRGRRQPLRVRVGRDQPLSGPSTDGRAVQRTARGVPNQSREVKGCASNLKTAERTARYGSRFLLQPRLAHAGAVRRGGQPARSGWRRCPGGQALPRRPRDPRRDSGVRSLGFPGSVRSLRGTLLPIMGALGADPGQPQVSTVHNIIKGSASRTASPAASDLLSGVGSSFGLAWCPSRKLWTQPAQCHF